MDKLGFLEGKEEEPVETPVEQEAPVETPAETPAEPAHVAEPAPVAETPAEVPHAPITALLDERERRKAAESELEKLRAAQETKQQPITIPDQFEDPDGYTAALTQIMEQRLYQQQLQMSERFARITHGAETTDAALNWGRERCASDPYFNAQVMSSGDPVGFTVQQFQRDQVASQVDLGELEQFKAWKAAQAQIAQQPAPVGAPVQSSLPTPSMASAPSAGGVDHVPVGPGQAFDALFRK